MPGRRHLRRGDPVTTCPGEATRPNLMHKQSDIDALMQQIGDLGVLPIKQVRGEIQEDGEALLITAEFGDKISVGELTRTTQLIASVVRAYYAARLRKDVWVVSAKRSAGVVEGYSSFE